MFTYHLEDDWSSLETLEQSGTDAETRAGAIW